MAKAKENAGQKLPFLNFHMSLSLCTSRNAKSTCDCTSLSSFHVSNVALVEGGGVLKYHGNTVAVSTFARIRMPAVTSDIIASKRECSCIPLGILLNPY